MVILVHHMDRLFIILGSYPIALMTLRGGMDSRARVTSIHMFDGVYQSSDGDV